MRWVVAKAKTKKQEDTKLIVEFKWLWHPHTPTKGQYSTRRPRRHPLTVEAILDSHCEIGALHSHRFTSYGFTRSAKSTLEKQTSQH